MRLKIGAAHASGDAGDEAETSVITEYSDFAKHLN